MSSVPRPIDDYALAAFIVGKVPGTIRDQILESLADDDDMRRLLSMVLEAFAAPGGPDDAMRFVAEHWKPSA